MQQEEGSGADGNEPAPSFLQHAAVLRLRASWWRREKMQNRRCDLLILRKRKNKKKKKTTAKIKTVKLKAKKYELGAGHSGHKRQNKAQMWGTQIRIAEDKSHLVVNEKPKPKKTRAPVWWLLRLWVVGLSVPWSVWSVWLLAGWLGVPASSFELRPRYNCFLDYFDLEKEDTFMLGHQCHQYTWFGPHVGTASGVPWSCSLDSSAAVAKQLALRVLAEWMRSGTWGSAL